MLAACGPLQRGEDPRPQEPAATRIVATVRIAPTPTIAADTITATPDPVADVPDEPAFVPDYGATATAAIVGTVPSGPSPYADELLTRTFAPRPAQTPFPTTLTQAPSSSIPAVGPLAPLTFSDGTGLTAGDLAARGVGQAGRGVFNLDRIIIPSIGADAPITASAVGADGKMPDPASLQQVLWYDFSQWPGLGGLPAAGGNALFAGDVAQPGEGPGVFVQLYTLGPGAAIQLTRADGQTLHYRVEFNKVVNAAEADWSAIVTATADDSMTIITGESSANRRLVWARRVDAP